MRPRELTVALALLVLPATAFSQTTPVLINEGIYSENFDSMGSAGTLYPSGWNGYKISGNGQLAAGSFISGSTNPALTVSNGGSGEGTVYNFGTTGDSDRALGTVASVGTVAGFGVVLVNNTGRTLSASDIAISFRQEEWRTGSSNIADESWKFEYRTGNSSLDLNDVSSVGWTQVSALDLNEIHTSSNGASAIDGNAVGNFSDVAGTLTGLVWNPGDRLVLRWLDSNNLGADTGMAVDGFNLTVFAPVPEPSTFLTGGVALAAFAIVRRRQKTVC